ncbi:WD40/YVTN/BNR-like repeat-containing protein [Nocardiopsis lambiniae]|uniref:Sialidase family protein n=1 Tax=Nocardiopsis lambiniae TaxID=3075539 RepID=A0ABU2M390_9ACTN|nr:sialidase family protein [Nocardiopsis sp. DSM 44743]MDT0327109.1 sialidase family protein [Nocardiopsis sp. DSM 44743]
MAYSLVIGTRKGLFTASGENRRDWRVTGPHRLDSADHASMSAVYAVGIDPHTGRVLAGAESSHFGPSVWYSDDGGASWHEPESAPIVFPEDTDASLTRVWQFAFGDTPGTVYAGVEPHALFRSTDGGLSFELVRALWDHPHRADWFPGAGGGAVHTVLPGVVGVGERSPEAMTVAMSTGGVYQTRDGGTSWAPANRGISAGFLPEEEPEYGQCVHKVALAADGSMYAQNHHGVYRSDRPAEEGWRAVEKGLPVDFGFAMVAHPHRPGTALNFPVISQEVHLPPDHRLGVYRTEDAGERWSPAVEGLPEEPYFGIVLRDAACTDRAEAPGFYFGTRTGDVYAADDDGPWHRVAAHLPDVLCVRAVEV